MIRQISNKVDIAAAPNLIWKHSYNSEAPGYSDEGVSHLYRSLFSICGSGLSQTRLY